MTLMFCRARHHKIKKFSARTGEVRVAARPRDGDAHDGVLRVGGDKETLKRRLGGKEAFAPHGTDGVDIETGLLCQHQHAWVTIPPRFPLQGGNRPDVCHPGKSHSIRHSPIVMDEGLLVGTHLASRKCAPLGKVYNVTDVVFRSDVTVELVRASAHDADVVFAARVSTVGEQSLEDLEADPAASRGLINYLMRERHGSPFEHNSMTFFVQSPIFVWREHMRHRIASYNEESGRYRQLLPVFYVPARERNVIQIGKTGAYEFIPGDEAQYSLVDEQMRASCSQSYAAYESMLEAGIAREVARMVLPVSIYSSAYVTMNARSLMNFLSLRRKVEGSAYPSYPQREIEMVAERYEELWAELMPLTHAAFVANGRVAP